MTSPRTWRQVLAAPALWWRAARIAVPVGFIQVMINQGHHLLHGEFTAGVITRTVLTPMVAFLVAFISAAATARAGNQKP